MDYHRLKNNFHATFMNKKEEQKWFFLIFMLALSGKLFIDGLIYFICFIRSWVEVILTYHLSVTYGLCYYDAIFINLYYA